MSKQEQHVRTFYSEIWDKKHFAELTNVLHGEFAFRGSLGHEKHGHEEFREYVCYVHSGLSDYRCTIEEIVEQRDKVFARMTFSGIHDSEFLGYPPTGKNVSWSGAALFTFANEKIVNLWVLGDVKGLEQQLRCQI